MAKTRVNLRVEPELWAWVQGQVRPGWTATDVVEQALRQARQGQAGASPSAPSPALERQRRINAGRG